MISAELNFVVLLDRSSMAPLGSSSNFTNEYAISSEILDPSKMDEKCMSSSWVFLRNSKIFSSAKMAASGVFGVVEFEYIIVETGLVPFSKLWELILT